MSVDELFDRTTGPLACWSRRRWVRCGNDHATVRAAEAAVRQGGIGIISVDAVVAGHKRRRLV